MNVTVFGDCGSFDHVILKSFHSTNQNSFVKSFVNVFNDVIFNVFIFERHNHQRVHGKFKHIVVNRKQPVNVLDQPAPPPINNSKTGFDWFVKTFRTFVCFGNNFILFVILICFWYKPQLVIHRTNQFSFCNIRSWLLDVIFKKAQPTNSNEPASFYCLKFFDLWIKGCFIFQTWYYFFIDEMIIFLYCLKIKMQIKKTTFIRRLPFHRLPFRPRLPNI